MGAPSDTCVDYMLELGGLAESSARLLRHSAALLEHVIKIAGTQTSAGEALTLAIRNLPATNADAAADPRSAAAIGEARRLARQAARATRDIYALVGAVAPVRAVMPVPQAGPARGVCMRDIAASLERLLQQASAAADRWPAQHAEVGRVARGVERMLTIAKRHDMVALQSAEAVRRLEAQAVEFVQAMERAGRLPPSF